MASSTCKSVQVSPPTPLREHTCDPAQVTLSQGARLANDQAMGSEPGLMDMAEVEYAHLPHLLQTHTEAHAAPPDGADARSHPTVVTVQETRVRSPLILTEAIDLSTNTDEHGLVMPGEKTPGSYGEVPCSVLERARVEDSPDELQSNSSMSSHMRPRSAAIVCLEKRFKARSTDTHSTLLSNFLTILPQSTEAQEAAICPQMQKWMKTDGANPFEGPFVGGVFNPDTSMCGVISHIPVIQKNVSLKLHQERIVAKAPFTSGSHSTEEQRFVNAQNKFATLAASRELGLTHCPLALNSAKTAPDSAVDSAGGSGGRPKSFLLRSQRRERHNHKERERRKRIRMCCDELNMLVPFCDSSTDKVTTLHWTLNFLQYINKMYGDTIKEEFQKAFTDAEGAFLTSSLSSDPVLRGLEETLSIPHVAEQ